VCVAFEELGNSVRILKINETLIQNVTINCGKMIQVAIDAIKRLYFIGGIFLNLFLNLKQIYDLFEACPSNFWRPSMHQENWVMIRWRGLGQNYVFTAPGMKRIYTNRSRYIHPGKKGFNSFFSPRGATLQERNDRAQLGCPLPD